jgi:hypothetical protein
VASNHLFIIGAPRSGTNDLRDLICKSPLFVTWPCDEINYAWKYSNKLYRYDDLNLNHINKKASYYLHHMFSRLECKHKTAKFIVEKTCANCLRIPFVDGIFNDSCYVYIRRDPRDVLLSMLKRWRAPIDFPYLFKKFWYVPKGDVIFYFINFLILRFKQKFSTDNSLPSWGPRFNGIDSIRRKVSFTELCLLQWYKCCFSAESNLLKLQNKGIKVFFLDYNQFVENPLDSLLEIHHFLSCPADLNALSLNCKIVHTNSVGLGLRYLDRATLDFIDDFLITNPQLPLFNGKY